MIPCHAVSRRRIAFGQIPAQALQAHGRCLRTRIVDADVAPQRYGAHYTTALEASEFLSLKSINRDLETFVRFLSQVKKHHLLAVFSAVRLHQIQATMNLRGVLEAGACAAFAIANPELAHFADPTPEGMLYPSQKLTVKRYKWLNEKFPKESSEIKELKEKINRSTAHPNTAFTQNNFRFADSGNEINTPFFDIEDEYVVKVVLLVASKIAVSVIDLFYCVNKDVNAIVWRDDFSLKFDRLVREERARRSEMGSTDRFKKAQTKFGK